MNNSNLHPRYNIKRVLSKKSFVYRRDTFNALISLPQSPKYSLCFNPPTPQMGGLKQSKLSRQVPQISNPTPQTPQMGGLKQSKLSRQVPQMGDLGG
jgi:hypothetical protein